MPVKYKRTVAVATCVGAFIGAAALHLQQQRACGQVAFVNRAVACDTRDDDDDDDVQRLAALENELRAQIGAKLGRVGLHFRDLDSGRSFGINEDAKFAPASLLKLPLAFTMFVLDSERPGTLDEDLQYVREGVRDYTVPAQNELVATGLEYGARYSVEKLLRSSIVASDNLAYYLVLQYLMEQRDGKLRFARTLQEIGIVDPETLADETVSPRGYGALFRMLYTASYLNVASSEKLLSWLSEVKFDKGLAAGVPKTVKVANKFGERSLQDGAKQLHDCGIIYHPKHPYSLCVMTRGSDFAELQAVVATISQEVYGDQ